MFRVYGEGVLGECLARSSTRARESRWYVMLVVQEGNDWGYFVGLGTGRGLRENLATVACPLRFNSDLVCRAQAVPVILPVNSTCVPSLFDYAGVTGCTVD
jgi:hypothetical protein